MVYTDKISMAQAYNDNTLEDGHKNVYTYECELLTDKILTSKEVKKYCLKFNIDYDDFVAELVSNPEDILTYSDLKHFMDICDGFFHEDYDPRDFSKDADTLLIFNPSKNVKIIKRIL